MCRPVGLCMCVTRRERLIPSPILFLTATSVLIDSSLCYSPPTVRLFHRFFFFRPLIINYRARFPAPGAGRAGNEPCPISKDLRLGCLWKARVAVVEVGGVGGADLHPAGGVNGSSRGAGSRKIRQPLLDFSLTESRLIMGDGSRACSASHALVFRIAYGSIGHANKAALYQFMFSGVGHKMHCKSLHSVSVLENKRRFTSEIMCEFCLTKD